MSVYIQWNPDITMYQGTGETTSLYRGIVKPGFRSIHFTVLNIGRAEKCQSFYRRSLNRGSTVIMNTLSPIFSSVHKLNQDTIHIATGQSF